jgi:hypothetical protein
MHLLSKWNHLNFVPAVYYISNAYKTLKKRTEFPGGFSFYTKEKALITALQHLLTDQLKH